MFHSKLFPTLLTLSGGAQASMILHMSCYTQQHPFQEGITVYFLDVYWCVKPQNDHT